MEYKKKLFIFSVVLLFFVSYNSLCFFIPGDTLVTHVSWAFYLFLFIFIKFSYIKKMLKKTNRHILNYALFLIFLAVFNKLTNREVDMLMLVNSLMFPVIVAVICNDESFFSDVCFVETAKKTLVSFFIINSLWALLERIFMYNIIPFYVKSTIEYVGEKIIFRSSALWGHGLAGAFVTTMLMMFFLYDESLSLFKKNALFILGFLAILCFNSRFDIVLCGAIYAIFLLSHIFSLKQIGASKRIFLLILALLGVFIGYLAMSKFGFGSRLLEMGLFDENSAGARTKIFDIFKYYDFSDFLLGIDAGSVQKVMSRSGFSALINENILLIFMFRFGLLFLIPLVYFAQKMVQCCMEFYPLRQKLLYGGCFLSIIMTFNSITTRESYFAIFILLLFVYRPKKCKHE